jgi:steroid delta-isomerase
MTAVTWTATETDHPARTASRDSMNAVIRGARDEWIALFAEDAVIEDPIGPSPLDPTGEGHHGHAGIAAFWDKTISTVERFEVANVGTITAFLAGGMRIDTEGVFTYRVGADGLIKSMRAFWEVDRAMGTLRTANGSST